MFVIQHMPEFAVSLFGGFARLMLPSKKRLSGKAYRSGIVLSCFVGLMITLWFEGSEIPKNRVLVYVMGGSFFANILIVELEKFVVKKLERIENQDDK